jgi:hypothetical protein
MRSLTLEERVSRLERLLSQSRKDEGLFGFGKLKAKDEEPFMKKLYKKFSSLRKIFGVFKPKDVKDLKKKPFYITLTSPNDSVNYGKIGFIISSTGGDDDVYCRMDSDNGGSDVIKNIDISVDSGINAIANFIMKWLQKAAVFESARRTNEAVSVTRFECDNLEDLITREIKNLPDCEVEVGDENAVYGFLDVAFYNPEFVVGYDIIVNEYNDFEILLNDKLIAKATSLKDAAVKIANHFKKNYT